MGWMTPLKKLGPVHLSIECAGERLDRAMAFSLAISRGQARRIIAAGGAWIAGRRCKVASHRCQPGDELVAYVGECGEGAEPRVIWSDDQLAVIDKPPGLASTPTRESDTRNADAWASRAFGCRTHLPHRLDRRASGLLLIVLDQGLNRAVTHAFREATIKRTYHVWTVADPSEESGELVGTLDGKHAALSYRLLAPRHLEVQLGTGRTHQIRRQLSEIGCPVQGDTRYGGTPGVLALRAVGLAFVHPGTGEPMTFEVLEFGDSQ